MRSFIEELRHRNVFRVGIAYIIAGWLIAQVADLAADAFSAPEWFMQMLIILLLMGLPIALFLAWAWAEGRVAEAAALLQPLDKASTLFACKRQADGFRRFSSAAAS